jgi:hypothetical protein
LSGLVWTIFSLKEVLGNSFKQIFKKDKKEQIQKEETQKQEEKKDETTMGL